MGVEYAAVDQREGLVKFLPTPLTFAVWAIFILLAELDLNNEPHPPLEHYNTMVQT